MTLLRPTRVVAAAVAVAAVLALPATAGAGPIAASATDCEAQSLSQVFLPWADPMNYTLNPGGDFESRAAGWSLDDANVVSGNEPFHVGSERDDSSLDISSGGSATSAPICVGIEHPDIRFFAKGGNSLARLQVEVLFETAFGDVVSAPVGTVTASGGWAPTAPMPIVANLLPLLPGEKTAVAFRFKASGGSFRIDDVYVDPYSRS